MACNFNIGVSPVDKTEFECQWEGGKHTFNIYVDSSLNNNSYYIENEGVYNWFTIERNRNTLLVRVNPYYDYDNGKDKDDGGNPREGYIRLVHNCDSSVTLDLSITQRGVPYQVAAETNEVTLPPLTDSETKIEVEADGGSEKFYVKSIKEYTNHTINIGTTENPIYEPVETDYDYGLKYSIKEELVTIEGVEQLKKYLIISSYGRAFVDEGYFYEITIAHRDYRFTTDTIRVYYEEPSEKVISVSPESINFDYHGIVTNEESINYSTIILTCNGEEIPDYGYTYEFVDANEKTIDESEISWLAVTASPTSLSFDCEQNCDTAERKAYVKVTEYTDPDEDVGEDGRKSKIITITQEVNKDCSIVLSQSIITVPSDVDDETYQTTFKVYGESKTCTGATLNYDDPNNTGWIKDNYKVGKADGGDYCLYTLYTLTFQVIKSNVGVDSNGNEVATADRTATITVTHTNNAEITATITIIQLGTEQSENGISPNYDTTKSTVDSPIVVTLNPAVENAQVTILSTGNWCKASATTTYDEAGPSATGTITVTCDDNHWKLERNCRLTLSNANNPNNNLNFTVNQGADADGNSFTIYPS